MEPLLQHRQDQSLVLAPQLRRSLEFLQASMLELNQKIAEELQTNPVLEEEPRDVIQVQDVDAPKASEREDKELEMGREFGDPEAWDQEWEHYRSLERHAASGQGDSQRSAERREHLFNSMVNETSLQEQLMQQARFGDYSEATLQALPVLIGNLDDRGFLSGPASSLDVLAQAAGVSLPQMQEALAVLQSLEPVGLGSRSVQECLLLQLKAQGQEATLAATIIEDHFDLLLRRKLSELSRLAHVPMESIREALNLIATLDPAPGRSFSSDTNHVITPDVRIFKTEGEWVVQLNETHLPRLCLSPAYKRLAAEIHLGKSDRRYLQDKIKTARLLIEAIEDRQKTLRRLSEEILRLQKGFFQKGVAELKPLTMSQMAELLEVHETTISRALANKYMDTPWGVFPLKYFFTSGYQTQSGQFVSNTTIKDRIERLIKSENPQTPYSDQDIVDILSQEGGVELARRTVAKYRTALGISPSHLRKG